MNSDHQAGAHVLQDNLDRQANLFLFDLRNEAIEHGFKAGQSWFLRLATNEEIGTLKMNHHPLISISLYPEALLYVFRQVKRGLRQELNTDESLLAATDLTRDGINSLAAYPAIQFIR